MMLLETSLSLDPALLHVDRPRVLRAEGDPRFLIQSGEGGEPYQLGLEIDGVLKTWELPGGPPASLRSKRLATRGPDLYFDEEPARGRVWDNGRYRNLRAPGRRGGDGRRMEEALRAGRLAVWLEGHRVFGAYGLLRLPAAGAGGEPWLMLKLQDDC